MNLREAAQQALEALGHITRHFSRIPSTLADSEARGQAHAAITALRTAIEQAAEPVASAWIRDGVMVNAFPWPPGDPRGRDEDQYWQGKGYTASPLYTHPPRREWQGLTMQEVKDLAGEDDIFGAIIEFARAIEAGLKEKNQ